MAAVDTETYEWNEEKQLYLPKLDATKYVTGCLITDEGEKTASILPLTEKSR